MQKHDASVLRPIFDWTAQQVIDYILDNGQQPNPLYRRGASRVGCFPCIMSRKGEIKVLSKDTDMTERLIQLEKEVDSLGQKNMLDFSQKDIYRSGSAKNMATDARRFKKLLIM